MNGDGDPLKSSSAGSVAPEMRLLDIITGRWLAQALAVVAGLDIAAHLVSPKTCDELAPLCGAQPGPLYRLLRALASIGVFSEDDGRRFRMTPLAQPLLRNHPASVRGLAILYGEEFNLRAWGGLLNTVRTDEPAFDRVFGQGLYAYLEEHPTQQAIFADAMRGFTNISIAPMLTAYDFSSIGTLVDVAGGTGGFLAAVLQAHPRIQGILLEKPQVAARAAELLAAAGVMARCTIVAGDFFEGLPPGGDVYHFKRIFHNWDDAECTLILNHCRRVVPPHGKVLIVEPVLAPGNEPCFGKVLDLAMLVVTHKGRERYEWEFRKLLAATGFDLQRVIPTESPDVMLEAVPA